VKIHRRLSAWLRLRLIVITFLLIIGFNDNEMLAFTDVYALKKAGFHDGSVSYVVSGKQKTHRGYKWRYEDRELEA